MSKQVCENCHHCTIGRKYFFFKTYYCHLHNANRMDKICREKHAKGEFITPLDLIEIYQNEPPKTPPENCPYLLEKIMEN